MRHTYATFAIRAGVSVFAVSRLAVVAPADNKRSYQQELPEALFRTRTGDPLLTMEVLYQLS